MKKHILVVSAMLVLALAAAAYSFTSSSAYQYGRPDKEYTMAVVGAGSTVRAGDWVAITFSDTNTDADTCAVVVPSATENSGRLLGVALTGGYGQTMIKVITRGPTTAYVNGVDSGTAAGIVNGTVLASGRTNGTAGAASTFMTAAQAANANITAAQAAVTRVCGLALGSVPTTDSGTLNKYSVYVMCR